MNYFPWRKLTASPAEVLFDPMTSLEKPIKVWKLARMVAGHEEPCLPQWGVL